MHFTFPNCILLVIFIDECFKLILVCVWTSQREIRQGEEIAWYADGETIVRSEHNPTIAYAYGKVSHFFAIYRFCTVGEIDNVNSILLGFNV